MAFTLVEVLVVITILITLAAIILALTRGMKQRADSARALANLRQSGEILLDDALEKGSKLQYYFGGGSAYESRHYNIVSTVLGLRPSTPPKICEIMHWNAAKLKPANYSWNCTAVNFTNVPAYGVKWDDNAYEFPIQFTGKMLIISQVTRPSAYPFLISSSMASGAEIFRINEGRGECVGLRNHGKAQAFFLDGAARELGLTELKKAGFTKAYDNSTTPPMLKTL